MARSRIARHGYIQAARDDVSRASDAHAAGVPASWLDQGEVAVTGLRTHHGALDFRLARDGGRTLVASIGGAVAVPPGGIEFRPAARRPARVGRGERARRRLVRRGERDHPRSPRPGRAALLIGVSPPSRSARLPGGLEHALPELATRSEPAPGSHGDRYRDVREALVPHADQHVGAACHAGVDGVLPEREAELRVEGVRRQAADHVAWVDVADDAVDPFGAEWATISSRRKAPMSFNLTLPEGSRAGVPPSAISSWPAPSATTTRA